MPKNSNGNTSIKKQKVKIVYLTSNNPKRDLKKAGLSTKKTNQLYKENIRDIS